MGEHGRTLILCVSSWLGGMVDATLLILLSVAVLSPKVLPT